MEYIVKVIDDSGICITYDNIVAFSAYLIRIDMAHRYRSYQVGIDCFDHIILDTSKYKTIKIQPVSIE